MGHVNHFWTRFMISFLGRLRSMLHTSPTKTTGKECGSAQPSPWIASDYRETFCRRSRGARVRPSCLERMKVWVAPQPKKRGTTEGLMKYGLTKFNKHKVRENQGHVSSVAFMWWKWLVKVVPTSLCCTCNMAAPQAFLHRNRPEKIEQWIPTFFVVNEFSVFLGDPIYTTSELPWAWLGFRFQAHLPCLAWWPSRHDIPRRWSGNTSRKAHGLEPMV